MNDFYTFVFMGVMIIGLIYIVVGWQSGTKWKTMGLGALLIAAGFIVAIGREAAIPTGLTVTVCVLFFTFFKWRTNAKENALAIGGTNLDRFYVECVLSDATDFSNPNTLAKAEKLARSYGLSPDNVQALFSQGEQAHRAVTRQHLYLLGTEEYNTYVRLTRYSDDVGCAKRAKILNDHAKELRKLAKSQRSVADMTLRSGQQREHDWASWGGAAQALGGLGAGIETAIELQIDNVRIREENKARLAAAMPAYMHLSNSAEATERNALTAETEASLANCKAVSSIPAAEVFTHLSFEDTQITITPTGAALVETRVSRDISFSPFDRTTVDGTLLAKIYDSKNQLCGVAQLVFPVTGVENEIPLQGICLDCCIPGSSYHVEFAPKNLWAMEA